MDKRSSVPARGRRSTPWQVRRGGRRYGDPARKAAWVAVLGSSAEPGTADELKQSAKSDEARINIEQDHELRYWCDKFGVSPEALRHAVAKAGPLVRNVRELLQRRA